MFGLKKYNERRGEERRGGKRNKGRKKNFMSNQPDKKNESDLLFHLFSIFLFYFFLFLSSSIISSGQR